MLRLRGVHQFLHVDPLVGGEVSALASVVYDLRVAQQVVGFEIRADSEEARRLVVCTVRRFTGNNDAAPDTAPGIFQLTAQAELHVDAMDFADQCLAQCADELGIMEPWELVNVLRP